MSEKQRIQPYVTSMGMFILDEVVYDDGSGREAVHDVIGGAGTYAALGARCFLGPEEGRRVGLIIDKGKDFPQAVADEVDSWGCNVLYRETPERQTTRGRNVYKQNEERQFEYVSAGIRIEAQDLSQDMMESRALHLICSPSRCHNIITVMRERIGVCGNLPLFVWEPFPGECKQSRFDECTKVMEYVDVFSPNVKEAGLFFGIHKELVRREDVETIAQKFLPYLSKPNAVVVIRCGAQGAVMVTKDSPIMWFPAYHDPDSAKVVDPTGGGNSFLGGFALGLVIEPNPNSVSVQKAAVFGNVAAGLAIEQIGLPKLTRSEDGSIELWNGESIRSRLCRYYDRIRVD